MNIVVVVSGGMTETLQAAPLIGGLAAATGQRVLVACPSTAGELAAGLDGVESVLAVGPLDGPGDPLGLALLWSALRRRRLDVAAVCSGSAAVRASVYLAAIPRRVGCGGGLSSWMLTNRIATSPNENRAVAWLGLAAPLGIGLDTPTPSYTPGAAASAAAEQLLLGSGVGDGRLLVAMAPGQGFAEEAVEPWGAERFAHLANRLASRHGAGVVLVGDPRDAAVTEAMRIDLAADSVDLCGEADLATTAAAIARCDLLVSADTPLLHVAAATGTASVGLFGPTDGRRRAPAGSAHRVVQALPNGSVPAGLDRIRVDDVLAGIEGAL